MHEGEEAWPLSHSLRVLRFPIAHNFLSILQAFVYRVPLRTRVSQPALVKCVVADAHLPCKDASRDRRLAWLFFSDAHVTELAQRWGVIRYNFIVVNAHKDLAHVRLALSLLPSLKMANDEIASDSKMSHVKF